MMFLQHHPGTTRCSLTSTPTKSLIIPLRILLLSSKCTTGISESTKQQAANLHKSECDAFSVTGSREHNKAKVAPTLMQSVTRSQPELHICLAAAEKCRRKKEGKKKKNSLVPLKENVVICCLFAPAGRPLLVPRLSCCVSGLLPRQSRRRMKIFVPSQVALARAAAALARGDN